MKHIVIPLRPVLWGSWALGVVALAGLALFPLSTGWTRAAGVVLSGLLWCGLLVLVWRARAVRFCWIALTLAVVIFLGLPSWDTTSSETRKARAAAMRVDYVKAMRRYMGTPYYWGGESPRGIDCSGLMRRGLIEALLWEGVRWCQPALAREAIWVWWNDTTARGLVEGAGDRTRFVVAVDSLNGLDVSTIQPGDLAITANGIHVLAYAGEREWIEADPAEGRVITIHTPGPPGSWLSTSMKLVRWRVLE